MEQLDEKRQRNLIVQASGHGCVDDGFLEHVLVAEQFFRTIGRSVYLVELAGVVDHGPQVAVTHRFVLGGFDHVFVVGFYIPHDGNVTTVINYMEGTKVIDNADVMFGGPHTQYVPVP